MFVGERMTSPVVTVSPDSPIQEVLQTMKTEGIRRTPVVKDGKLEGIVSEKDLLNATPSIATSLSVWELNYLLSKITVSEMMTKNVITVTAATPIEEAARIMADNKIGGLPVLQGTDLVGIITETDLFRLFLELTGAREFGVRATFTLEDQPGELAKVAAAVAEKRGNVIAIGTFSDENQSTREVVLKVGNIELGVVEEVLKKSKEIGEGDQGYPRQQRIVSSKGILIFN
jgi:acetoin utilization protein AcuB